MQRWSENALPAREKRSPSYRLWVLLHEGDLTWTREGALRSSQVRSWSIRLSSSQVSDVTSKIRLTSGSQRVSSIGTRACSVFTLSTPRILACICSLGSLPINGTSRLERERVLCQGKVSKMEDDAQSYWRATAKPFEPPPAELPSRTDVVVIGAGFTGISAAPVLAERGASVAVLDSQSLGWGASTRNGGMMIGGLTN